MFWSVCFSKVKDIRINFRWESRFDCSWGSLLLLQPPNIKKKKPNNILKNPEIQCSKFCLFLFEFLCVVSMGVSAYIVGFNTPVRMTKQYLASCWVSPVSSFLELLHFCILLVIIVNIQGFQFSSKDDSNKAVHRFSYAHFNWILVTVT